MSLLADAIFVAMTKAAPPGKSVFSVERVPESVCATTAPTCPGAKRSSFYGGWVRQELREHAEARYRGMAEALAREVAGAADPVAEAGLVVGIAVNESGLREDIQFGRGRSLVRVSRRGRLTRVRDNGDDAGGQGRGPSNETCLLQVLPSMAKKYGGAEALLGDSPEALRRCFRAGIDQLHYARAVCTEKHRRIGKLDVGQLYATVSRYGTGNSCTSPNMGKTEKRVKTATWVTVVIRNELASLRADALADGRTAEN